MTHVTHWSLKVAWSDESNPREYVDVPDYVAEVIDQWLTELERDEDEINRLNKGW